MAVDVKFAHTSAVNIDDCVLSGIGNHVAMITQVLDRPR
jgi:hypothetical protein